MTETRAGRPGLPTASKTVLRDVGALQVLIGGLFLVPLLVSLLYGEWYSALSFLIAAAITVPLGWLGYWTCRNAPEPKRHHAMIVAALGWLATAFFGALPFVIAAYITPSAVLDSFVPAGADYHSSLLYFRNPLHAFFESMSAYTTTGLTMSVREPSIGHGMLFYRSFAQWIGGAGMIVLSLAILRQPYGSAGSSLYKSEAKNRKLRPSIVGTARAIWKVYLVVTALVTAYIVAATYYAMPNYGLENTLFDAVNHAMTGQSTGGFSTLDDSIAGYGSQLMEIIYIVPMISGAIAIPVYYAVLFKGEIKEFFQDTQIRMMFSFFAAGVIGLSAFLTRYAGTTFTGDAFDHVSQFIFSEAFRDGSFQYISGLTTTGWQTSPIGDWNMGSVLFMVLGSMLIGGSAGAT
ncbi:MAG: TrkH family potassium uptake protein, partial [bacterium]